MFNEKIYLVKNLVTGEVVEVTAWRQVFNKIRHYWVREVVTGKMHVYLSADAFRLHWKLVANPNRKLEHEL